MTSDIHVHNVLDKVEGLREEAVNIRVVPQLFDHTRGARGMYVGWPGISWISVMNKTTVARWLDTVEMFFAALGKVGSAKMQTALKKLVVDE